MYVAGQMTYKGASLHEYARCLKGNNKCGRWTRDNIQFSCWTDRIFRSDSDVLDAMGLNPPSGGGRKKGGATSGILRYIRFMISLPATSRTGF